MCDKIQKRSKTKYVKNLLETSIKEIEVKKFNARFMLHTQTAPNSKTGHV